MADEALPMQLEDKKPLLTPDAHAMADGFKTVLNEEAARAQTTCRH